MTNQNNNLESQEDASLACPSCGSKHCYTLSDERKMCRDCRKKFTPHPKAFRLPISKKKQIAANFWGMIHAEEVAKNLELNRKTLQRYYRHLRHEIAHLSIDEISAATRTSMDLALAQDPADTEPTTVSTAPACYITTIDKKPRVLSEVMLSVLKENGFPVKPCAKIIYKNGKKDGRFKLDHLYIRKYDSEEIIESYDAEYASIRKFWLFAIPQLSHYKVINNNNLFYFLKEMEFRFNVVNEEDAISFLINKLSTLPEN